MAKYYINNASPYVEMGPSGKLAKYSAMLGASSSGDYVQICGVDGYMPNMIERVLVTDLVIDGEVQTDVGSAVDKLSMFVGAASGGSGGGGGGITTERDPVFNAWLTSNTDSDGKFLQTILPASNATRTDVTSQFTFDSSANLKIIQEGDLVFIYGQHTPTTDLVITAPLSLGAMYERSTADGADGLPVLMLGYDVNNSAGIYQASITKGTTTKQTLITVDGPVVDISIVYRINTGL